MEQKIQRVSIKAIFFKEEKIFMLKDEKGKWEFPGGGIEFGEHPEESLQRELKEELGIDKVQIGDIINVWDFVSKRNDVDHQHIIIVYECKADLSNISISSEHVEHRWITLDEINSSVMNNGYKETINKFIKLKSK